MLLEFGVVSRRYLHCDGEHKVVITNRAHAELFADAGRLRRCQAGRSCSRSLARYPRPRPGLRRRSRSGSGRVHPQRTAAVAGSTRNGCASTTSTGSPVGSVTARRSSAISPIPMSARSHRTSPTALLLRPRRVRDRCRRAAGVQPASRHRRPRVHHQRVRQPQHRGAPHARWRWRCCVKSTRRQSISSRTTTGVCRSRPSCRAGSPTCSPTARAASPSAWPPTSRRTTCASSPKRCTGAWKTMTPTKRPRWPRSPSASRAPTSPPTA